MVKHIVLWNFKADLTDEEREDAGELVKTTLEALKSQIKGISSLEVKINDMSGSTKDIALISKFTSIDALNAYQVHPLHVEAGKYIKAVTQDRECFDYEM